MPPSTPLPPTGQAALDGLDESREAVGFARDLVAEARRVLAEAARAADAAGLGASAARGRALAGQAAALETALGAALRPAGLDALARAVAGHGGGGRS